MRRALLLFPLVGLGLLVACGGQPAQATTSSDEPAGIELSQPSDDESREVTAPAPAPSPIADGPVTPGCWSVRVSGCGRKARVCVNTASSYDAEAKAEGVFKRAYSCSSAAVQSSVEDCTESAHDKCDLRQ